jgi:uncharacterized integral membrane protein (TIGR00697 family)
MRILAMLYITILLAATVVAYRIVLIGSIPEPGSTLIYTFSFFLMNVFSEIYGPHISKKLIWESIGCGYLFAILLSAINLLPAPSYLDNTGAYNQVLGHLFRFTNAGVIGYLLSTFLNVYLLTKWKFKMGGRFFWARSLLASTISEGAATFIAGVISFLGMMPVDNILIVMTSAFIFKILYGFIAVFPASFLAFILKKTEKDVFINPTINPFQFS